MIAEHIACALGGAHRSSGWWRCRCPVHRSRGATLALRDGDRGLIVKCFADCDPRVVLAEIRRRGLLTGATDHHSEPIQMRPDDRNDNRRRIVMAQRIWNAARDARGSPVERYLAGRGITITLPPSLRWVPSLRHPSGIYLPAMVTRVENVDGEAIAIHRTFLRPDGTGKADVDPQKAMLGPVAGGVVRLALAAETLLAAEGIETALAVMQATSQPGWAALSTSGLVALRLPPIVRTVVILADHDANGAGERAARIAANRWLAEGRRVRIALPSEPDTDFADVLAGRTYASTQDLRDVAA